MKSSNDATVKLNSNKKRREVNQQPGEIKRSRHPKSHAEDMGVLKSAPPSIGTMAIDKLVLDVPASEVDVETALERARQICRTGALTRGSTKSIFFKSAFVLKLPSGAIVRFHMVPNNRGVGANMQLVLNPNQMEPEDCSALIRTFKALFPLNAVEIAASMLIRRIDVCIQLGISIEHFIIELKGARSSAKVFLATDRDGQIQTIYMGSVSSAHHGVAYDQEASDEYKRLVGEKPSRTNMSEDAELVMKGAPKKGRMQLESRRVFKRPVALAELSEMKTPLSDYRILQLAVDDQKWDTGFSGYVDMVRLRGVHGARAHMQKRCGSTAAIHAQLKDYEQRLAGMSAPWWKPEQYAASLLETLKQSAAWKFLRVMEKTSANADI